MAVLNKIKVHALLTVLAAALFTTGCRIESPTYPFRVKVTNASGVPIQNVVVEVSVDVPNYRDEAYAIDTTGFDGIVEFEYDLEAVFKVTATRGVPYTHIGCGFIKLEPNKVAQTTIILLEYDPNDPGC